MKKNIIIIILSVLCIVICVIIFFAINKKDKNKILSIMSYDNKEEFVLFEGKYKNYNYNLFSMQASFEVEDGDDFISKYVKTNEYLKNEYSFTYGLNNVNKAIAYEFIFKNYSFYLIRNSNSNVFLLNNSTIMLDTTYGNYVALFPYNLISDLPTNVKQVDIDYEHIFVSISDFDDLKLWYSKIGCQNVTISDDGLSIIIKAYPINDSNISETVDLIIYNDNSMVVKKTGE